jgi:hypothetical protein
MAVHICGVGRLLTFASKYLTETIEEHTGYESFVFNFTFDCNNSLQFRARYVKFYVGTYCQST